ncbi:MAG: hypothetical protein P1U56_23390 [Saprospiraceae bacterium]|nr:hypothetical protein [Saprospiraceae bacterium]
MIRLSDYLNYLNNEVVQARKQADEHAIKLAKEYSEHPYLKYFKAPRFSMPNVKLNIPIKINELDSTTTYNFDKDFDSFVSDVNSQIATLNDREGLSIMPIAKQDLLNNEKLVAVFEDLEAQDYRKVRSLKENMKKINISDVSKELYPRMKFSFQEDRTIKDSVDNKLRSIIETSLQNRYMVVRSNLRNIYIDPDTSSSDDKGKILLNLEVDMIEEGIRIRSVTDKNGNEVEEIIVD